MRLGWTTGKYSVTYRAVRHGTFHGYGRHTHIFLDIPGKQERTNHNDPVREKDDLRF